MAMKVVKSAKQLTDAVMHLKKQGKRVGFVPTMGYLHEGHISLVRRARKECDIVVVSIYVNPLQFGPKEDLKRYPRNLKRDSAMLRKVKTDFLFVPDENEIYPKGFNEFIAPGPLAHHLCGLKRPGHFRGVVTVVNRLFKIVQPDLAYFGQKDFQQVRVIQEMVRKVKSQVKIVVCPIVREPDGLAMSSRNSYLTKNERVLARSINQSLARAHKLVRAGERNAGLIKREMRKALLGRVSKIDYIEIVSAKNLRPVKQIKPGALIAIACFVGRTRLIDNLFVSR